MWDKLENSQYANFTLRNAIQKFSSIAWLKHITFGHKYGRPRFLF